MVESHAKCVTLGRSIHGATVVGRDSAFIQPVDPRILYQYYHILDGNPASLGFSIMHRVHAICTQSIIAMT